MRAELENLETAPLRQSLHGARLVAHATAGRPVRLRQDQRDLMSCLKQPGEGALGECRGPRED